MNKKVNLIERIMLKMIRQKVATWFDMERSLTKIDKVYTFNAHSPVKSWPDPEKIPSGNEVPFTLANIPIVGLHLKNCIAEGMKAIKSIERNPHNPKREISHAELKAFEHTAKIKGIDIIGYCELPEHLIFEDRAVLYNQAIVFAKEMDKDAILKAPSVDTFKVVMSTYDTLGIITNEMTEYLRDQDIQAQASHPLGGLVVYPPLAAKAGLGWFGKHGLLITPEFGARQRLSAVFVNVDNLPLNEGNDHTWLQDFCQSCGRCVRTCPGKAIMNEPITHPSGRKTCISRDKCLTEFVNNQGCTICIKDCIFTSGDYHTLRENFHKNRM